ncbi:FixH family protein [Myxococcus landrumensis]|uniref:FixH family protein n=1 Tax=Myxococcus landrumensis TaxID=2813577 RepID=A0ABX7N3V9_9BACT|nr:FixH family protein [Myxococcus landrumus]QSQ13161.1 FixH family protein [Myxococcus landrumus]
MKTTLLLCLLMSAAPPAKPEAPADTGTAARAPRSAPVATVTSTSGRLRIDVMTDALPLRRGPRSFLIRVTESTTGKPVPGLRLAVQPWMPTMGHGLDEPVRITARGDSDFEISDLDLFMPGAWELRLTLSGTVDDKAVVAFKLAR